MRKIEYLPWLIVAIVSLASTVVFICRPSADIFSQLGTEIIGTLVGFSLALSFAELIKISDKYSREKNITKALINEVTNIVSEVDERSVIIITDMWDMAIASNDLCAFNLEKLLHFGQFYARAKIIHEMGPSLKQAFMNNDRKQMKTLQHLLSPILENIRTRGNLLLQNYS